ncbi:hypothetical protein Llc71_11920 [Lactococcus cremoris]|nr:hypothetical protein Llc71_11920 [Lactococcus cremoris]
MTTVTVECNGVCFKVRYRNLKQTHISRQLVTNKRYMTARLVLVEHRLKQLNNEFVSNKSPSEEVAPK